MPLHRINVNLNDRGEEDKDVCMKLGGYAMTEATHKGFAVLRWLLELEKVEELDLFVRPKGSKEPPERFRYFL